jgi:hypothetical protein
LTENELIHTIGFSPFYSFGTVTEQNGQYQNQKKTNKTKRNVNFVERRCRQAFCFEVQTNEPRRNKKISMRTEARAMRTKVCTHNAAFRKKVCTQSFVRIARSCPGFFVVDFFVVDFLTTGFFVDPPNNGFIYIFSFEKN